MGKCSCRWGEGPSSFFGTFRISFALTLAHRWVTHGIYAIAFMHKGYAFFVIPAVFMAFVQAMQKNSGQFWKGLNQVKQMDIRLSKAFGASPET